MTSKDKSSSCHLSSKKDGDQHCHLSAPLQPLPLSVVIASLGTDILLDTIESLISCSYRPNEIIICLPPRGKIAFILPQSTTLIRILHSTHRGQVHQRCCGLINASQLMVMQMDDDVILDQDTLHTLYQTLLHLGPGNVLAPYFRSRSNGSDSTIYNSGLKGFLASSFSTLVCGASFGLKRMGNISPAGIGYGISSSRSREPLIESEWLPGGACLSYSSDLITTNYYPFQGKAYSEDLIHSILWTRNGIRLWTVSDAHAFIADSLDSFLYYDLLSRFRAHRRVARMLGYSGMRTSAWFLCFILRNIRTILLANIKALGY